MVIRRSIENPIWFSSAVASSSVETAAWDGSLPKHFQPLVGEQQFVISEAATWCPGFVGVDYWWSDALSMVKILSDGNQELASMISESSDFQNGLKSFQIEAAYRYRLDKFRFLGLNLNPPKLKSTAPDVHLDIKDDECERFLLSLNLGAASRYFKYVTVISDSESLAPIEIMVRVEIPPKHFYLAPTERILHTGETGAGPAWDVALFLDAVVRR